MKKTTNELSILENEKFDEILLIIENSKTKAYAAVNKELIEMYWQIGKFVSERVALGTWGSGVINEIAKYIQKTNENVSGFSPQNLRRMRQFYETYKDDEICSTLLSKLSWSINIRIMSAKSQEEREFYLRLAIKNRYSYRELDRQMDSSLYERTLISKTTNVNTLITTKHKSLSVLRDSYVLEFLDMPKNYKEKDLRKAIVSNLKDFILEFGKEFAFVGEEYRVQVGNTDFFIDLVFYNRELACLVAIELKTEKFKPEHVGQIQFYLEALDRDVKKKNENPSVGLILCAEKDDMVVEYALSRSLTPSLIAAYELILPDKKMLQSKLKEIADLTNEIDE